MKMKLSRELVVAQEIVGYLLIMVGLSFYVPQVFIYLFDYFAWSTARLPGAFGPVREKPTFPNLPSIWIALPCILAGIAVIVFARIIRKTFKTE